MKGNKLYIIAAFILIAGLVVFICGFSMVGFDIRRLNTNGEYERKTTFASSDIIAVLVDTSNVDVKIVPSSDRYVHITYYENGMNKYNVDKSENMLKLEKVMNNFVINWFVFNIDIGEENILVEVPNDFDGRIDIKTSNAKIISEDISANKIKLRTLNGKVSAENVAVNEKLDIKTSNGSVTLNDIDSAKKILCETTNNKIVIENVVGDGIELITSNGKIQLKNVTVNSNLSCETKNGAIEGDISGRMSDYTISSKTTNAKNNLPEYMESGNKSLRCITTNGKIEIDFFQ